MGSARLKLGIGSFRAKFLEGEIVPCCLTSLSISQIFSVPEVRAFFAAFCDAFAMAPITLSFYLSGRHGTARAVGWLWLSRYV